MELKVFRRFKDQNDGRAEIEFAEGIAFAHGNWIWERQMAVGGGGATLDRFLPLTSRQISRQ